MPAALGAPHGTRQRLALVAVSLVAAPAREYTSRRATNDVDGMPALLVVAAEPRSPPPSSYVSRRPARPAPPLMAISRRAAPAVRDSTRHPSHNGARVFR